MKIDKYGETPLRKTEVWHKNFDVVEQIEIYNEMYLFKAFLICFELKRKKL